MGQSNTTYYLGSIERVEKSDGSVELKRSIGGFALWTEHLDASGTQISYKKQYLIKDVLGSVSLITDHQGGNREYMAFGPWGERVDPANWASSTQLSYSSVQALINEDLVTTRGFTGHEMLDAVGLIHMNGRIYDPRLGRFLQADPFVQAASDTQMFNRYSYVRNNPLNATDPSGYFIFTLGALITVALDVIAIEIACIAFGAAAFADALIQGANLGDALLAGVSAAALSYVGGNFIPDGFGFNLQTTQYVATVGAVGGLSAVLQGGKFGHGFVSAGLGAATRGIPGLQGKGGWRTFGRTTVAAIVGGTSSAITGGKFANGAAYAAFAAIVSSAASSLAVTGKGGARGLASEKCGGNWCQTGQGKTGEVTYSGKDIRATTEQIEEVLETDMTNSTSKTGEYGFTVERKTAEVCVGSQCKVVEYQYGTTPVKLGSGPQGTISITGRTSAIAHAHPTGGSRSYRASNETFGPGDHASIVAGVGPNFVYTPSGVWKVLEGHSGYLWERTLTGDNAGTVSRWTRTMD